MQRRTVLRAVGVVGVGSASGCLSDTLGDSFPSRSVSVTEPAVDQAYDTAIDVLKRSGISTDSTAMIDVTVHNERETARTYTGGSQFPFAGKSTPTGLVLEGEDPYHDPVETTDCWSIAVDGWPLFATSAEIASGESLTTTLSIWDDADVEGCFPTGEYRFSDTLAAQNGDESHVAIEWGFTVTIA